MKKVAALRGAVFALNEAEDVVKRVNSLYKTLLSRNNLLEDDVISVMFTVTPDIDCVNPASALRKGGCAARAALFCAQEPVVRGGRDGVIRVMIHCNLEEGQTPVYVYQNGAEVLRPDINAP